jgi:hypothetical protein
VDKDAHASPTHAWRGGGDGDLACGAVWSRPVVKCWGEEEEDIGWGMSVAAMMMGVGRLRDQPISSHHFDTPNTGMLCATCLPA